MDGHAGWGEHYDMSAPVVVRPHSSLYRDRRDAGRALRVTWHPIEDLFVLSTWHGGLCAATVQLSRADVPDLIGALAAGLADTSGPWSTPSYSSTETQGGLSERASVVRRGLKRLISNSIADAFRR